MTPPSSIEKPARRPGLYRRRIFPARLDREMDTTETRRIRAEVCGPLVGEVVEIGFGTGHNLPYLPAAVSRLIAIEPDDYVRARAGERLRNTKVAVEIVPGTAERLPLPDCVRRRSAEHLDAVHRRRPKRRARRALAGAATRRHIPLRRTRPVAGPPSRPLAAPTQPTPTAIRRWLQPRPGHRRAHQLVGPLSRCDQLLLPRRRPQDPRLDHAGPSNDTAIDICGGALTPRRDALPPHARQRQRPARHPTTASGNRVREAPRVLGGTVRSDVAGPRLRGVRHPGQHVHRGRVVRPARRGRCRRVRRALRDPPDRR